MVAFGTVREYTDTQQSENHVRLILLFLDMYPAVPASVWLSSFFHIR